MKKILLYLMFVLSTFGFTFDTWYGSESVYKIETGYDTGTETSGYWFIYGDDADGGASKITWDVEPGNEYSADALDPIIDYCGGVCGTFTLNKGTLDYNPFVGIGFNIAGEDESGTPAPADATDMGGICIGYSVDAAAALEMGLGDAADAELGYDNPFVSIPKSATGTVKEFTWTQFKQAGWGTGKITGDAAAAKLVALKFKIQAATGTSGRFNIMSFGAIGGNCSIGTVALNKEKINKDFYTITDGVISFNQEIQNFKLVNLNGSIIKSVNNVKSVNLSSVTPGVYFVKTDKNVMKIKL